jgi:hypothetical protein
MLTVIYFICNVLQYPEMLKDHGTKVQCYVRELCTSVVQGSPYILIVKEGMVKV